jgi:hypothetical protein
VLNVVKLGPVMSDIDTQLDLFKPAVNDGAQAHPSSRVAK